MGPPWPYPQLGPRKTGGFDTVFGIGMIVGGVFAMGMCGLFLPMMFTGPGRHGGGDFVFLLFPLIGVAILVMGVASLVSAKKQKEVANRLFLEGIPCWAQVMTCTPAGNLRQVNALRWVELVMHAQPYAAATPHPPVGAPYRGMNGPPPGVQIAPQITVDWFVSELQTSLTQPGAWLAVLVHPQTLQVHLDGFAGPNGVFVPTQ